jgi:ELWxxDGT repeat protein
MDINPGQGYSNVGGFCLLGDRLFFAADDGVHGSEPWVTDGTPEGTVLLKDIKQGEPVSSGSFPRDFTPLGGRLVFTTLWPCALWATDGTADQTVLLAEDRSGQCCCFHCHLSEVGLLPFGDRVFFEAGDGTSGWELWVTDGTPEGTVPWRESLGQPETWRAYGLPTPVGDRLFFTADDGTHGTEPWVTDGSAEGTVLVKDINPGSESSGPWNFTALGDRLLFDAYDGTHGTEPWVTDGTPEGTALLKDIMPGSEGSGPWNLTALGDRLFFRAVDATHGSELWVTDGTPATTIIVKDINPGSASGLDYWEWEKCISLGDRLIFVADDGMHGQEPWVTDGTPEGTVLLQDIHPGPEKSLTLLESYESGEYADRIPRFIVSSDRVFFVADDGVHGGELWVTDGTPGGTVLVKDIYPGSPGSNPSSLAVHGERLYFMAWGDPDGRDLWVTDGTPDGTLSIAPGAIFALPPYCVGNGMCLDSICPSLDIVHVNGFFFFVADDGVHGLELWALDHKSPSADFTMAPEGCQRSRKVLLDAGPSLPGDASEIVRFEWNLGAGVLLEGPAVEYEYPFGVWGPQRICLTVTNDKGIPHSTCKDFCIEAPVPFRRGDPNDDGAVDISDVVFILGWLFLGTSSPPCAAATDTNGDGTADISDAVSLLGFLFLDRPPPSAPFPGCGPGTLPTDEVLGCATAPVACGHSEGGATEAGK